jgi:hypothetical protein
MELELVVHVRRHLGGGAPGEAEEAPARGTAGHAQAVSSTFDTAST